MKEAKAKRFTMGPAPMFAEVDPFLLVILGLFAFSAICFAVEPFVDHVWPLIWPPIRRIVLEILFWTVSDDFADEGEETGDGPRTEN